MLDLPYCPVALEETFPQYRNAQLLLHRCRVSPEAVAKRDEMVFQAAYNAGVPICMALSGGYAKDSAGVISSCIKHVIQKFGLIQASSKM